MADAAMTETQNYTAADIEVLEGLDVAQVVDDLRRHSARPA